MAKIKPIQQSPVPPTGGAPGGLGEKLKQALIAFWTDAINRVSGTLSDIFRHGVDSVLETLEVPLLRIVRPMLDKALAAPGIPPEVRTVLESARSGESQVGAILLAFTAIYVLPPLINALFAAPFKLVEYVGNKSFKPNRLDFGSWWLAFMRDPNYWNSMIRELEDQGWTREQIDAARLVAEKRLDVGEAFAAFYRGVISRDDLTFRLLKMGIAGTEIPILIGLSEQLPGPSDLVRYAVREAWRDDVAARWGFDQARPGPFDENMKKVGFPAWVAQAEWRSHWQLPSLTLGFEMFYRGEISEAELRGLLTMQDIAPGWIPHVMAVARPIPGRIDRRWAYEEGIIGTKELYELYRAEGYDDRWASIMVQMIVSRTDQEAKGLTRAAIESAYGKGRLSRSEALGLFAEINIREGIANWYLDQGDMNRQEENLDRRIKIVGERFVDGLISSGEALEQLGALGAGGEESRLLLEEWTLKISTAVKRPTRANLDKFFEQGTLTVAQYRDQMALLNYDPQYIGWYLQSLAIEIAQKATVEEERAQKERLRVAVERKESAYAKAKAELDRDIAELNAAIADSQVALIEAQNERDRRLAGALDARQVAALEREYQPLFNAADAEIAQARLQIQKLQTAISGKAAEVNELKRNLAQGRDVVAEEGLKRERLALQTAVAELAREIAGRRTDIARLEEAIPLLPTPEERGALEQDILALRTAIREAEESQAEQQIRVRQIDELLPVQLSAEARVAVQSQIDALQADVDQLKVQIEQLDELIREVQVERKALGAGYDKALAALPGIEEQIAIRAEAHTLIDNIESRIAELRANVAQVRVRKSELVVGWRA